MKAKLVKFISTAYVIIEDDNGNAIGEVTTRPFEIFKSNEIKYDEFINGLEQVALQSFSSSRPQKD